MKQIDPVQHEHQFKVVNPLEPERDRCSCGTFRYDLMAPLHRREVRLRAYGRFGQSLRERR